MHVFRTKLLSVTAIALLFLTGCLRICEQRITVRHEPDADMLYVMIHYDGIHDSGDDQWGNGAQQLPEFIAADTIAVLDWMFQVQVAELRGMENNQELSAELRALGKAMAEQVKVEPVGYYRDALGRIGGAQIITITKASAFIRTVNAAINGLIRDRGVEEEMLAEAPGTSQRILLASENQHQWVTLDGHAVKVSVPVQPTEWAALKAKGIYEGINDFVTAYENSPAGRPEQMEMVAKLTSMLADIPFAYSESSGMVSLRIGDPAKPTPIRLQTFYQYQPNLEAEVIRIAKTELDAAVARQLAGLPAGPASANVTAIAEWGPDEERVRAMARAVESDDPALTKAAFAWLNKFRIGWNHENNLPVMPVPADEEDPAAFGRACLDWCRELRAFPNPRE